MLSNTTDDAQVGWPDADIEGQVDGTPGTSDMPGNLARVFNHSRPIASDLTAIGCESLSNNTTGIGSNTGNIGQFLVHGGGNSIYVPIARSSTKWISIHSGGTDPAIFCDTALDATTTTDNGSARMTIYLTNNTGQRTLLENLLSAKPLQAFLTGGGELRGRR